VLRGALIACGGVLITAASWSVFRHGVEHPDPGLPILGTIPEFSLLASSGERLSRSHFAGEAWVADFIFTQCPGLCPVLSGQMQKVQGALVHEGLDATRLVSFSVDPAHDTPEALRAYAERFHASAGHWLFLTGDHDALYSLIGQGFHLAVAERPDNADGEGLITHTDRFVLVDRDLQIRAYYHGTDADVIALLLRDLKTLNKEQSAHTAG